MENTPAQIVLAHGGGGELTKQLIEEHILPRLGNDVLQPLTDGAVFPARGGKLCITTDSYVVQPLEFPGGDIGRLAVCGTVNDLAVMGAVPRILSLAMIIEEGLKLEVLDRVLDSIAAAAEEAGVLVATGDTKVIERRQGDGLMITTAGVGELRDDVNLGTARIRPGDTVLLNGRIAEHGLAVMSVREGLAFDTDIASDVASLNGLLDRILSSGADVKFLRDATRGGVAGVCVDICEESGYTVELEERCVPISVTARHTAEILGLDPLTVANEGKCVIVTAAEDAETVLAVCREHPLGRDAAAVGRIADSRPPLVELICAAGGRRVVQRPYGEELPRIC